MSAVIRRLAAAVLATLALVTAACGGGDGGSGTSTGPGPVSTTGFSVRNGSAREAWYVYSRACGTASWGEDQLGSANILMPGESVTWSESAGCYDLLALTARADQPRYQARYDGKTVSSNSLTSLTIANGDWTVVTEAAIASLAQRPK